MRIFLILKGIDIQDKNLSSKRNDRNRRSVPFDVLEGLEANQEDYGYSQYYYVDDVIPPFRSPCGARYCQGM